MATLNPPTLPFSNLLGKKPASPQGMPGNPYPPENKSLVPPPMAPSPPANRTADANTSRDTGWESFLSHSINTAKKGQRGVRVPNSSKTQIQDTFNGMDLGQFEENLRAQYSAPGFNKTPWVTRSTGADVEASGKALATPPMRANTGRVDRAGKPAGLDALYTANPAMQGTSVFKTPEPVSNYDISAADSARVRNIAEGRLDAGNGVTRDANGSARTPMGGIINPFPSTGSTPTANAPTKVLVSPFGGGSVTNRPAGTPPAPGVFKLDNGSTGSLADVAKTSPGAYDWSQVDASKAPQGFNVPMLTTDPSKDPVLSQTNASDYVSRQTDLRANALKTAGAAAIPGLQATSPALALQQPPKALATPPMAPKAQGSALPGLTPLTALAKPAMSAASSLANTAGTALAKTASAALKKLAPRA